MQRATPTGPSSTATPRAPRRSAEPQADDAERLPCLATRAPAPAATKAASVDTLMVHDRSPPVPQVSSSGPSTSTRSAYRSIVRTRAAISAGVSPLARRAMANPAIWAGVARPSRIVARAPPASPAVSSSPRISLASSGGHRVPASIDIRQRAYRRHGRFPGYRTGPRFREGLTRGSGGAAPLAEDPAALPFCETAPHSVLLAGGQRELQAGLADGAHAADHLRFLGQAVVVRRRIEDEGVTAPAEADGPPVLPHRPVHLLRPATPLQHRASHDSISPRWHRKKLIGCLFPNPSRAMPRMSKFVHWASPPNIPDGELRRPPAGAEPRAPRLGTLRPARHRRRHHRRRGRPRRRRPGAADGPRRTG